MKKLIHLLLLGACFLSLALSVIDHDTVPQCFNADEAAFGYNAYSILKTGRDEYGAALPVRLKSFGDYKLPLYTYGSVPFIAAMGLNEAATRALSMSVSFLLPIAVFFLARELFRKDGSALLAAFLVSTSLALHIVSRHAHEAYLTVFLITTTAYLFLRFLRNKSPYSMLGFFVTLSLCLLGYQSSRLFAGFFFLVSLLYLFRKKVQKSFVIIFFIVLIGFGLIDIIYKPARVNNLVFWNTPGFTMQINDLRAKGGNRFVYNKATVGAYVLTAKYLSHLSPEFLVVKGDSNPRFGFPGMSPMTWVEYVFIAAGIFFLFKNKSRYRYYLLGLLLISPLTSSLSWLEPSITRSLFFFVPALIISAYGVYELLNYLKRHIILFPLLLGIVIIAGLEIMELSKSWSFYLKEYTKQPTVTHAWQCGYRELTKYVEEKYDTVDRFYISRANGQPYIFMLYYLRYPPEKYQPQASLTGPDEYGFGQVEKFDKFVFSMPEKLEPDTVVIGSPKEFNDPMYNKDKTKKININGEDMFWIYEP